MRLARGRIASWAGPLAAWALAIAAGAHALHHPSLLLIDFGAGDEAVASGFAEGWASYDVRGKATFRWTGGQACVALPLEVQGRAIEIELRLARFAERATAVTLVAGGSVVGTWTQHPVGWRQRVFTAGSWRGPLALELRAAPGPDAPQGIALDWLALRGVEGIWPAFPAWVGIMALAVGVPLAVGLGLRTPVPAAYGGATVLFALALWAQADTVAALTTAVLAGPRVLLALALLVPLLLGLARLLDPEARASRAFGWVPLLVILVALVALTNPRYHYPDVDTHARFLAGLGAHPHWALDPREDQEQARAWTRLIGDRYIGFPYSTVFHVLAWPMVPLLGDVGAVKVLAVLAAAAASVLVFGLARATGAGLGVAVLAQALFALMPVVPSRLTLALLPSLLGQAMELLLLVVLATRLASLGLGRERLLAFALLLLAQVSYVGSLFNVAAIVGLCALAVCFEGRWRSAASLLAAYGLSAATVVALQYRYFIPTLFSEVLPHLAPSAGPHGGPALLDALALAGARFWIFFGPFGLALALFGYIVLARGPAPVRRVLLAATAGGLLLALLRAGLPVLFSDAKEVELMTGPIAVAVALGVASLYARGRAARISGLALLVALVLWSAYGAAQLYSSRLAVLPGSDGAPRSAQIDD